MAEQSKDKYIKAEGIGRVGAVVDPFREGGRADKIFEFLATKVGKAPGTEGENFLKAFNAVIGAPEFLAKGALHLPELLAYPAFAAEWIRGDIDGAKQARKLKAEEREAEARRLLMKEEEAFLLEEYHTSEGFTHRPLDAQAELIDSTFDFGNADIQAAFRNINLADFLYVNERNIHDRDRVLQGIADRRQVMAMLNDLLGTGVNGTVPERLVKVFAYLANRDINKTALTVEEQQYVNGVVGLADPVLVGRLLRELLRILPEIQKGRSFNDIMAQSNQVLSFFDRFAPVNAMRDSRTATQLEKDNERLENERKEKRMINFLDRYQFTLISGETLETVRFNDDLSMPGMLPPGFESQFRTLGIPGGINPFINLGFVSLPTEQQIIDKRDQFHRLQTDLPTEAQFMDTYRHFYSIYPDQRVVKKNVDVIKTLSRKQLEAIDSLSKVFLWNDGVNPNPVRISYKGQEIDIPAADPMLVQLREALDPEHGNPNHIDGNIVFRQEAIQDLLVQLEAAAPLTPAATLLVEMLNELMNIPFLMNDLVFGSQSNGYADSVINFIKNLNHPGEIFKYLFIHGDGDIAPQDRLTPAMVRDQRNSIQRLLRIKRRVAQGLLDVEQDPGDGYKNLIDLHLKHLQAINNGDILVNRRILGNGDHLGYINDLRALNNDMVRNLRMNVYPEIVELCRYWKIEPRMLEINDYNSEEQVEKLQSGLSALGKIVYLRMNELIRTKGDVQEHDEATINEIRFLRHYLTILKAVGFNADNIMSENCINEKLFRMYIHGYDLKRTSSETASYDENVGEGDFTLTGPEARIAA